MDIIDSLIAKKIVGGGGGGDVPEYTGSYTVTPSESAQTLATKDKKATDNITVNPIPSQYVVPTGTKSITQNGTGIDVAAYADVDVNVPSVTPTGTIQITQNGQVDVTQYASADVNVPTGGGVVEAPMKDVNFYDYDGTRLYSYTAQEFLALSAMPANPTHSGLTAQGWNWTLADAKDQVNAAGGVDIGQMYITDDGKTRLYVHLEAGELSPCCVFAINGTATIDWGDGSTTSRVSGTSISTTKSTQHTYQSAGEYVIQISVTGQMSILGDTSTSYGSYSSLLSLNNTTQVNKNRVYSSSIRKIELGSNVTIGEYAFYFCTNLETVTIPQGITELSDYSFYDCAIKVLIAPSGLTSIGGQAFGNCRSLHSIMLPKSVTTITRTAFANLGARCDATVVCAYQDMFYSSAALSRVFLIPNATSIPQKAFSFCFALQKIRIPNGVTSISNNAFDQTPTLANIVIAATVDSIGSQAFNKCYGLGEIHFLGSTPPTVANSNAWTDLPTTCKIYVPAGSLSAFTSATNYPSASTYTYVEE